MSGVHRACATTSDSAPLYFCCACVALPAAAAAAAKSVFVVCNFCMQQQQRYTDVVVNFVTCTSGTHTKKQFADNIFDKKK